jgi:hypothetical protein
VKGKENNYKIIKLENKVIMFEMYKLVPMSLKLKHYNNLPFSILFSQTFSLAFLHGHEQFDINSDRLLKTIWERIPKLK